MDIIINQFKHIIITSLFFKIVIMNKFLDKFITKKNSIDAN